MDNFEKNLIGTFEFNFFCQDDDICRHFYFGPKENMLFIFVSCALSLKTVRDALIYDIYRIHPFYFSENGKATIKIQTKNFTNINFQALFMTKSELKSLEKQGLFDFIAFNRTKNLNISRKFSLTSKNGTAKGELNITDKGLYFPFIINYGNERKYEIRIKYSFSNGPQQFVDERNKSEYKFHYYLSIIYFAFALAWLINGLYFTKFSIYLHTLSLAQSIIKGLYCCYYSGALYKMETEGIIDFNQKRLIFLYFLQEFLFSCFHCILTSGLFIFRDKMMKSEIINIIKSSILYGLGLTCFNYAQSFYSIILSLGISSFGVLLVTKIHIIYAIIIKNATTPNLKKCEITAAKSKFYCRCLNSNTILYLLSFFIYLFLSFSNYEPYAVRVSEIFLLIFYLEQMRLFMFRVSYTGKPSKQSKDTKSIRYTIIKDPVSSSTCFLTSTE